MSYILEALKRADAERERGAAPGLHSRHQMPADPDGTPTVRRSVWLAAAAGLTLVVLAFVFWFWRAPPDVPPMAALQPATSPMPNTVAPAKPAAITPIAPVPIVVAEAPAAKAKTAEKTNPKIVTAPAAAPASKAAPAPATAQTANLLSELPTELRSQIPKITITGSVYSDSPAQRLLLVNNLVLSQGSPVTPDLKLEEIQPRSSVFNYKGARFRVMH